MAAGQLDVVSVRVAGGGWRDQGRGLRVVWQRELIRFARNRLRILTSLAQPILFLFVLGTGLSSLLNRSHATFNYRTFMFPGVLAMTVLFTAIFSAISIVWDREFGFLREMLVAPVSRGSVVVGKCFGGATVATIQGLIMLALAGLVGIPYEAALFAILIGEMLLIAITLTALGVALAARMQQVQSFQVVTQFFVLPMFFLSGAIFPLSNLPRWLEVLAKIDPLTYAVNPMRHAILNYVTIPPAARAVLDPPITWFGWPVPIAVQLLVVAVIGTAMLILAVVQFSKPD